MISHEKIEKENICIHYSLKNDNYKKLNEEFLKQKEIL
jgi:hypothetical protein